MPKWWVPRFPDSPCMYSSGCLLLIQPLVVDFPWRPVPQPRVQPSSIVAQLDVASNVTSGMLTSRVLRAVHQLVLQDRKERSRHSIVVADTGASHRLGQPGRGERGGELNRRVVAASIRVEHRPVGEGDVAGGRLDRRGDQRRFVVVVGRVADDGLL